MRSEADTSVVSATVGQKRIVDLPLNGRDWTQLATLQPGVTNVRSQQTGGVSIGGNRGIRGFGAQLTTNGHSPYENTNVSTKTTSPTARLAGPLGVNLGVDAIQEFSVVTSAYTAEYGRVSGAVVNAVTRSHKCVRQSLAIGSRNGSRWAERSTFEPPARVIPTPKRKYQIP